MRGIEDARKKLKPEDIRSLPLLLDGISASARQVRKFELCSSHQSASNNRLLQEIDLAGSQDKTDQPREAGHYYDRLHHLPRDRIDIQRHVFVIHAALSGEDADKVQHPRA